MSQNTTRHRDYEGRHVSATVVEFQDAPAQCTIYPTDVTDEAQLTMWISARGDAFVDPRDRC